MVGEAVVAGAVAKTTFWASLSKLSPWLFGASAIYGVGKFLFGGSIAMKESGASSFPPALIIGVIVIGVLFLMRR